MRSLWALLEHEALGHRARFERYAADLLYAIAAGKKIDTDRFERFGAQVDKVYANPFEAKEKPMTAAEVKQHICERIDDTLARMKAEGNNGSDETGGPDHAG